MMKLCLLFPFTLRQQISLYLHFLPDQKAKPLWSVMAGISACLGDYKGVMSHCFALFVKNFWDIPDNTVVL